MTFNDISLRTSDVRFWVSHPLKVKALHTKLQNSSARCGTPHVCVVRLVDRWRSLFVSRQAAASGAVCDVCSYLLVGGALPSPTPDTDSVVPGLQQHHLLLELGKGICPRGRVETRPVRQTGPSTHHEHTRHNSPQLRNYLSLIAAACVCDNFHPGPPSCMVHGATRGPPLGSPRHRPSDCGHNAHNA